MPIMITDEDQEYNPSKGVILSIIGGIYSIALGFLLGFLYPILEIALGKYILIFQGILIGGGIIILIGSVFVSRNIKLGKCIIMIDANLEFSRDS